MTEAEWLSCTDKKAMAAVLGFNLSRRKERLFSIACCRRTWHLFTRPGVREAILVGERYADGQASAEELRLALRTLQAARAKQPTASLYGRAYEIATIATTSWLSGGLRAADFGALASPAEGEDPAAAQRREQQAISDLIREIFGNPFRPARFDPAWRTASVEAMAQSIYADHDFDAMPVLADALEEAGCDEADLLSHCRSGGPHFRGCWAVDLILGKT
jgi:hypothetical protein